MTMPLPPCRLFILFARSASRAVIFRRGPSGWCQLILWHTLNDTFEYGQWFHGRIYVRRSDLSPDGTKLIYFAQKINEKTLKDQEYTYAWTAISKPPFYTALALWPKGDCWHGGGLFDDDTHVLLNHRPDVATPHPSHQPQGLKVRANPEARGEDDPLFSQRLARDGWHHEQEWLVKFKGMRVGYVTEQPEVWVRRHPDKPYHIELTRRLDRLAYTERFRVLGSSGESLVGLEDLEWAEWDQQGRLVLLRAGKVWIGQEGPAGLGVEELVDLNGQEPRSVPPSQWAREW
jgi:hypothetical protein